jgi:hypothetical protein
MRYLYYKKKKKKKNTYKGLKLAGNIQAGGGKKIQ